MPHVNGYSIYASGPTAQEPTWTVAVYSDMDDTLVHRSEGCHTLSVGMREAEREITQHFNTRLLALSSPRTDQTGDGR